MELIGDRAEAFNRFFGFIHGLTLKIGLKAKNWLHLDRDRELLWR